MSRLRVDFVSVRVVMQALLAVVDDDLSLVLGIVRELDTRSDPVLEHIFHVARPIWPMLELDRPLAGILGRAVSHERLSNQRGEIGKIPVVVVLRGQEGSKAEGNKQGGKSDLHRLFKSDSVH